MAERPTDESRDENPWGRRAIRGHLMHRPSEAEPGLRGIGLTLLNEFIRFLFR